METEGRRDDQAPEEQKDRNDRGAASELSDRAAESVGRRYDATKEIHHEPRDDYTDDDASAG
ncbi:hypothetical protein OG417_41425 [Actinoallomurus sp. NBC_01490]|jgi:hypothetical protein|uniref:hypothetical protein n=1 Tax=Actinoallomurus sp. NBC_01490 TaxID=2903557 RepID=UPI002E321213|nr:hypothetical protein [Actinoallomurus sp. NBC_01490]